MDDLTTKPIFDYAGAKTKDMEVFNTWKQTGSKEALGLLMKQLQPMVYSQVERVSGTLPKAALSAEAKKWTINAIQSYDPTRGTALASHVMNYLPKIRRLNYKYQNSARLPENLQLQYTTFQTAVSQLQETLGRDPTDEETAKELGWGKPLVTRFKASLYDDLVESASPRMAEVSQFNDNKFLLDHIMANLNPQEKFILGEANDLSAKEAAAKLGVNISRLNYLKSKLRDKILGMKQEIGMY
jgi:DNA-directed RNA polymerase specialized sigma subunit